MISIKMINAETLWPIEWNQHKYVYKHTKLHFTVYGDTKTITYIKYISLVMFVTNGGIVVF